MAAASGIENSTSGAPATAVTRDAISCATPPSTVLPGDTRGASGRRPNRRPTKYAADSPHHVTPSANSVSIRPPGSARSQMACPSSHAQ